ncbi:MAG: HPr family phosphocarrier protein [Lachnospiraceae bacterium]|jgi:catabolite repression HPr-like protein|nr:HPr family phosphocarrier protein [Lachnospiraceae bacterium]
MMEKSIKLQLDGQLEARPIAMLVQVASQYDSTVYLETEGRKVNAKSIMGMMSLASSLGTEIRIITDGSDEEQAMAGMEAYLSNPEGK